MSYSIQSIAKALCASVCVLVLASCGVSKVVIEGSYPTPNVAKLPLTLAVVYDEPLRSFSYIEYSETGAEEFNIASGESHVALFDAVLPAMFQSVVQVASLEDAEALGVDAIFVPAIDEFQLALPYKTKLDVYEVWIRYNLRFLTGDGAPIADWVLTSYGKTPTESMRTADSAINDAAVVALRDLASSFSLSFAQVPEVRDWLASR
jgi:hypothetical protein|tara:strand:+ start:52 stop:669 length:618 start_codon:yes stop_codon:yes gene_type:complete